MAFNQRVGTAVLELRTDSASYTKGIENAKQYAKELGAEFKRVQTEMRLLGERMQGNARQIATFTRDFSGDRQIIQARSMLAAVERVGGVARLTAQEQARVNGVVTQAIEKYRALGQVAPAAMIQLANATKSTQAPTDYLSTRLVAMGAAVGTFAAQLATQGIRTIVSFGREALQSAGNILDLSNKTGLGTATIQRMQFVADQTSTSLEAMTEAAFRLGVKIAGGGDSVTAALSDLKLDLQTLQQMRPDQMWEAVVGALSKVENATERNRIGVALFGRSFSTMAAAVAQGYEEIASKAQLSSDAQLEALDRAGDRWAQFVTNTKSNVRGFLGEALLMQDAIREIRAEAEAAARIPRVGAATDVRPGRAQREINELLEAQRRVTLGLVGAKKADVELTEAGAVAEATYAQQLAKVRAELAALTPAQRREIEAAQQLGVSTDDLEAKYGLTEGALKLLNTQTKAYEKSQKDANEAAKRFAEGIRDLSPGFARFVQVGNDANVVLKDMSRWFGAMPPAITAAADAIQGRLLTNLADLGSIAAKSTLDLEQFENALYNLPAAIESGNVTGEVLERRLEQEDEFRQRSIERWQEYGRRIEDSSIGRLGTLAFGQFGHDASGELKAAADEAEQTYLKLQRSGKATAQEIQLAFQRWRDAEERANFTFSERWKQFMGGIKQTFVGILDDMLSYFTRQFLGGLIRGIAGARLGQALGNAISGGVAGAALGGGAAAATGLVGGAGALPGALAAENAALGAGAAGGGFGSAVAGLATNPITWGVAAGALLTWGIAKKGWFRGGEEGVQVNPRRDRFTGQFGGFMGLAARLTEITKQPGGGPLMQAIASADTVKKYEAAQSAIIAQFAKAGQRVKGYLFGGFVKPYEVQPAVLHGGRKGELIIPLERLLQQTRPNPQAQRQTNVNVSFVIQAWDGEDVQRVTRQQVAPYLRQMLHFNMDGFGSAVSEAVQR